MVRSFGKKKEAKATYQAICVRAAPSVVVDIWYLDVNVRLIYRLLPETQSPTSKDGNGILPADIGLTDPHPRGKTSTHAHARYPPRAAPFACARYPRAPHARGHIRIPASS